MPFDLVSFSFFGCNHYYSVGSAYAVDGCLGGVFEHLYRLYVVGIDHIERSIICHPVEDDQWCCAGIEGVDATNNH